jgi:hypothetical protein
MYAAFLVCGLVAYVAVLLASPGYLKSGYFERYVPIVFFVTFTILPVAVFLLLRMIAPLWRGLSSDASAAWKHADQRRARFAGVAASLSVLMIVSTWIHVQRVYIRYWPPDRFPFLSDLRKPPFAGASFISNTYAAPLTMFTGRWAYFDPEIGTATFVESPSGVELKRDMNTYLWLADKSSNVEYAKPAYFICMIPANFTFLSHELAGKAFPTCADTNLVKRAHAEPPAWPTGGVVLEDTEPRRAWAIVKLNWGSGLPYLKRLASGSRYRVDARITRTATATEIEPVYDSRYGLDQKAPDVRIRLYQVGTGKDCAAVAYDRGLDHLDRDDSRLIEEGGGGARFALPADFEGVIRITVLPLSDGSAGTEEASADIHIGERVELCTDAPQSVRFERQAADRGLLKWRPVLGARLYRIEMRPPGHENFVEITHTPRSEYELAGLNSPSPYSFRVRACQDLECGAYSAEVKVLPHSK